MFIYCSFLQYRAPPTSDTSSEPISKITFLDKWLYLVSHFFLIKKIKNIFLGKKAKKYWNAAWNPFLCETISTNIQKVWSFFAQNGVFNFWEKKRLTRYNHLSWGFQKSLNIWNRFARFTKGGGGAQGLHCIASYVYTYQCTFLLCTSYLPY